MNGPVSEAEFRDTVVALVQQASDVAEGTVTSITVHCQSNGQYPYRIFHTDDEYPWVGVARDDDPPTNIRAPLAAEQDSVRGFDS